MCEMQIEMRSPGLPEPLATILRGIQDIATTSKKSDHALCKMKATTRMCDRVCASADAKYVLPLTIFQDVDFASCISIKYPKTIMPIVFRTPKN